MGVCFVWLWVCARARVGAVRAALALAFVSAPQTHTRPPNTHTHTPKKTLIHTHPQENNNDGESHNLSWNCGEEGPTSSPPVNRLRARQVRNMAAALLLSHGVPMVQMGDEYGHSKGGNNNTYCHDSGLNWVDWQQVGADAGGFGRFMRRLINFR